MTSQDISPCIDMTAPVRRNRSMKKKWGVRMAAARLRASDAVHRLRELDVELGHAAGIVSRERHLDGLVDVEPFGMVVELLGHQGGAGHEAERRVEVREHEFPGDGVAPARLAPA